MQSMKSPIWLASLADRLGHTLRHRKNNAAEQFLLMSNARTGSSFLQSSLSALGASGDFEYSLRPYNEPMPHQRFLSSGIADIAADIRSQTGSKSGIVGSKLTLPIYDFLSDKDCHQIFRSCRNISKPVHLVRHYWDVLKSNLSRGVAHDFNPLGKGWARSSEMHSAYSKLPDSELGREKPSVFVELSEESFKKYLANLIRNDYVFGAIRESKDGERVPYEALRSADTFGRLLAFIGAEYSDEEIKTVIENPLLRQLPPIPDSNIPHAASIQGICDICYSHLLDARAHKENSKQIFKTQMHIISLEFK